MVSGLCGLLLLMWDSKRTQLITIYSYVSNRLVTAAEDFEAVLTLLKDVKSLQRLYKA
jgi:hypothetical protein